MNIRVGLVVTEVELEYRVKIIKGDYVEFHVGVNRQEIESATNLADIKARFDGGDSVRVS